MVCKEYNLIDIVSPNRISFIVFQVNTSTWYTQGHTDILSQRQYARYLWIV